MSATVLDRPPATEAVVAPAKQLRLSEAMRAGALQHSQGYGAVYNPATGTTCALGALLVGLVGAAWMVEDPYLLERHTVHSLIWEHAGVDLNHWVQGPTVYDGWGSLGSIIMRLNDVHGWGREKIADWLASIGY